MRRFVLILLGLLCALLLLGAAAPDAVSPSYEGQLCISELMVKNRAALPNASGGFPDWVELENISSSPVSLEGWALSDRRGSPRQTLEAQLLQPGERCVVFCREDGFSLSLGETLLLLSPDGLTQDEVLCSDDTADRSLARQEDGSFLPTDWISPGYPNTAAGYESFCSARQTDSPLWITEVVVNNVDLPVYWGDGPYDWVELQNVSFQPLSLEGFQLSDSLDEPAKWTFPDMTLEPGAYVLVLCAAEREPLEWMPEALNAGFNLDSLREELYLRSPDGTLLDYVSLHDIPPNGSLGREAGRNGFLYYAEPTPNADNSGGRRRVAVTPTVLEGDGVYEGQAEVTVRFSAPGELYYAFGGALPTRESELYLGPITIDQTAVVRAVAYEDDALPSLAATCSVILNEGHTLPVLSLVVDDGDAFRITYQNGVKGEEYAGNLALYDGEHSFSRACGVGMRGWTSLELPKKSFGVVFRDGYGGDLQANVFDNGVTRFHSLAIRAGQDYPFTIFRNELAEDLCLDAGGRALTQASKFCVLYLNGEYYGIYCLKEDFSRQYFASHMGVSKESVSNLRGPISIDSDLYDEIVFYAWNHDMSTDEAYRHVCEQMDIDSLIDWFLLESYVNNTDIQGNIRYLRSPEIGGRWYMAFYDLDWSFLGGIPFSPLLEGQTHVGDQMPLLLQGLCQNPEFRARVLTRYGELVRGVLSDEHVIARIDAYTALLEPEAARDRERWNLTLDGWHYNVEHLRSTIADGYAADSVFWLCEYLNVTPEERAQYFGF